MPRSFASAALLTAPLLAVVTLAAPLNAALGAQQGGVSRTPELPRAVPALPPDRPASGRVVRVPAGADLQAALDAARGGDRLELAPGAEYRGSFVLRRRAPRDTVWITVSGAAAGVTARGTRVGPADAPRLASLVMEGGNEGVVRAELGAHHYRLVGVELTVAPETKAFNALVRLSNERDTTAAGMPHHLVIERAYIHGRPDLALTRCVLANAAWFALVDSYVSECHTKGKDSQAFVAWGGPGPYLIENNYLEGAGENLMFGGARATAAAFVPKDVTIRGNYLYKPRAWQASRRWTVKNLLEIKQGERVLVEGNVLRNVWKDAQTGRALLIRAADQEDPKRPWARTRDVTVRDNWIDSTVSPLNLDAQGVYEKTTRVRVEGNLMTNASGAALQVSGAMEDIAFLRNTSLSSGGGVTFDGVKTRFTFTGNVLSQGKYGVKASGMSPGGATLAANAPGAAVAGNVMVGRGGGGRTARRLADYPDGVRVVSGADAVPAGAGADAEAVMRRARRAIAGRG